MESSWWRLWKNKKGKRKKEKKKRRKESGDFEINNFSFWILILSDNLRWIVLCCVVLDHPPSNLFPRSTRFRYTRAVGPGYYLSLPTFLPPPSSLLQQSFIQYLIAKINWLCFTSFAFIVLGRCWERIFLIWWILKPFSFVRVCLFGEFKYRTTL